MLCGMKANMDDPTSQTEERGSARSRPKITFMNMIASAICSSRQKKLSLQEIYHYIMEHHGQFYNFDNRKAWQNAVRHNLSLHECFVKIRRPARILSGGRVYETTAHGCYWALDELAAREFELHGKIKRRPSARIAKMRNTESPPDASKRRGRPSFSSSFRDPHLPLPIAPPISLPRSPSQLDLDFGISPPESPSQSEMSSVSGMEELQEISYSLRFSSPPASMLAQSSQEIRRLYVEVLQMYHTFA